MEKVPKATCVARTRRGTRCTKPVYAVNLCKIHYLVF